MSETQIRKGMKIEDIAIRLEEGQAYKMYGNDYNHLLNREDTDRIESELVRMEAGKKTPNHIHSDLEQVYIILEGKALLELEGKSKEIEAPAFAYIPRNSDHRITALEDLSYVYVSCFFDKVTPNRTEEERVVYEKKLVDGDS